MATEPSARAKGLAYDEHWKIGSFRLQKLILDRAREIDATLQGIDLHSRIEFALRDAGFGLDEASKIATLADGLGASPVQPAVEVITPSELWAAVSGNPDFEPTKQEALDAARACADAVDEDAENAARYQALKAVAVIDSVYGETVELTIPVPLDGFDDLDTLADGIRATFD